MNRKYAAFVAGLIWCVLASAVPVWGQTAPTLGPAEPFAVLGQSTVTNTGPTVVNGSLGVSPGSSVTGFPPGVVNGVIHSADATAGAAQTAATAAYNELAGQGCTANLTGQNLGGLTLTSGVYCYDTSAGLTGGLTLDAQGAPGAVFIIRAGSTLTTASGSRVDLINGAQACNVFWQIGSSATLGTSSIVNGNILAVASITLTTGAQLFGRALARNGAVTLDSNLVESSSCAAACPVITLAPPTLPNATQGTAYSQQLTGNGGTAPYGFALSAGTLPAGLTLTAPGVLAGTPTAPGSTNFAVRATDAGSCSGELGYALTVLAPVPTLAQWAMIGLTMLLTLAGFAAMRRSRLGRAEH